ncbi:hypothetical protein [Pedobacter metabolipauper]|uniref:Putative transposase/invertase (TIGR01784 family) n=1 Tax=Pedobacter metabolipauper TaxID=425513 RepID=A0A4R6SX57_9SPHI|nr:hypothetical protein [Pedobacter metabolipauper]TDQ10019.1 putative transposase/invertase (TIGR01784 family) [Pedobacter metabolipauper]
MYRHRQEGIWTHQNLLSYARKEGKTEGKLEGKLEVVKKLKTKNFTAQQISELTDLSIEEIEKL